MPNDNRVTQEQIEDLLNSAETQEHVFWNKELVVSYRLSNGFTVTGRGACVDPANFDPEIGRQVARRQVEDQLWQLEGYRKQLELAESGALPPPGQDDGPANTPDQPYQNLNQPVISEAYWPAARPNPAAIPAEPYTDANQPESEKVKVGGEIGAGQVSDRQMYVTDEG